MTAGTEAVMDAEEVVRRYPINAGLTLEIRLDACKLFAGTVTVLQAPSGAGKSTLLAMLGLAARPDAMGRLRVGDGTNVFDAAAAWRRRDNAALRRARQTLLGFVTQTGALMAFLTLRQNILLPLRLQDRRDDTRFDGLVQRLGLEDALDRRPGDVSQGQRQRAALARALVTGPKLLLADEPTAALDIKTGMDVDRLLLEAVDAFKVAALIASHRPDGDLVARAQRLGFKAETTPNGTLCRFAVAV